MITKYYKKTKKDTEKKHAKKIKILLNKKRKEVKKGPKKC